jgi:hypothetical protein
VKDLAHLDALIGKNLPALYALYEREQRALHNLRQQHAVVQEALEKFDVGRRFARVVLPLVTRVAPPAGSASPRVTLRYTYSVPASYSIDYRLLAYPKQQTLTIEQSIALQQDSGFAWRGAEVTVASIGRDRSLQPVRPRRWLITEQPKAVAPLARRGAEANLAPMHQMAAPVLAAGMADGAEMRTAAQEQRSTFRVWNLGRLNIAPAIPVRTTLASDSHKVNYYYTLRPANYFRAFLTADLDLPAPLELPQGQARFFVDDAILGQSTFSFNGQQGTIFFGADPLVTGTMQNLKRSSGESGIIRREQTLEWNWNILVSNNRSHPVEVRVEDPMPESTDESFRLEVRSSPQPEETRTPLHQGSIRVYRWKLQLNAGEQATINHEVRLLAPQDRQVIPGRGAQ